MHLLQTAVCLAKRTVNSSICMIRIDHLFYRFVIDGELDKEGCEEKYCHYHLHPLYLSI